MKSRFLFTLALSGFLLAGASQVARGQICAGSKLNYVARDAKGAIIENAWPDNLHFEGEAGKRGDSKWISDKLKVYGNTEGLPPEIVKLTDRAWSLKTNAMCVFETDLKLRLTLNGKTMSLLFHMPRLGQYDSKEFIVDSLKFHEGSYEILLNLPQDSRFVNFFPAAAWKKLSDKAESAPPKSP